MQQDLNCHCSRNESGLPFFDVILVNNLPKSASLPVATSQQVKKRIINGSYDFDYIYFTESDQVHITSLVQAFYFVV